MMVSQSGHEPGPSDLRQGVGSLLAAAVQQARLLAHVRALEGERHPLTSPARLARAERYVTEHWTACGLRVASDEFSYKTGPVVNHLAAPPRTAPGPRLLIGAHLDTVSGTPGADDNASGLAALLELSQVTASLLPAARVAFAAFALEECGMVGSAHYAERLKRERVPLLGMLSLEMLGFTETRGLQHYPTRWLARRFPSDGTYIGLAGNLRSRSLLQQVAAAFRAIEGLPVQTIILPGSGRWLPESRLSDHAPFWDCGFPALLVTDTAFLRNPHYHQATDTADTLDAAFLTRVTRGIAATIERLAA